MAHKRLRDWPIMAYKYGLMINEGMPETWWKEHALWCDTWNKLVETNRKLKEDYQQIFDADQVIKNIKEEIADILEKLEENKKDKALITELKAKRADLKTLKAKFNETFAEKFTEHKEKTAATFQEIVQGSDLYWTHKSYLLESFWLAIRKSGIEGPHFKSKYRKDICLLHRYTGGGAELDTIFRKNKRVWIEPVDLNNIDPDLPGKQKKKKMGTKVHVWLCGEEKIFNCVFHRPLPEGSIVKEIKINANSRKNLNGKIKWKWGMAICLEIPPDKVEKKVAAQNRKILAIELGWRKVADNLRIGVSKDESGKYREIYLPDKLIESIKKTMELQAKKDTYLNKLRELFKDSINKTSGISKYMNALPEVKDQITKSKAEEFIKEWRRACGHINACHGQTSGHRKWLYYNIANKLCRDYHTIIIKDMDIKSLAMPKKDKQKGKELSEAQKRAQKYRALASIGEFRNILGKVAVKYDTNIAIVPGENTTLKHFECGHTQENLDRSDREKQYIQCQKCEEIYDQDYNAVNIMMASFFANPTGFLAENRFAKNNENHDLEVVENKCD